MPDMYEQKLRETEEIAATERKQRSKEYAREYGGTPEAAKAIYATFLENKVIASNFGDAVEDANGDLMPVQKYLERELSKPEWSFLKEAAGAAQQREENEHAKLADAAAENVTKRGDLIRAVGEQRADQMLRSRGTSLGGPRVQVAKQRVVQKDDGDQFPGKQQKQRDSNPWGVKWTNPDGTFTDKAREEQARFIRAMGTKAAQTMAKSAGTTVFAIKHPEKTS